MKDNSRFVLAVHTLTLLARSETPLSSNFISSSAGVNAVTIRKVVGQLRDAGLVKTQTGVKGGTKIARNPADISLKETFLAVRDEQFFGAYPKKVSEECPVGRCLKSTLTTLLDDAVQSMITKMDGVSIADVVDGVKAEIAA
ncbi:MAG: Rrf2 family transcriptional regulator [Chloroflexota bacterium]